MEEDGRVAYFKVLCWHLTERTEENHENYKDIPSPGRDLNPAPPE
jgi:hypothetical protein